MFHLNGDGNHGEQNNGINKALLDLAGHTREVRLLG
jgi:hypothetical protein